MKGLLRAKLLEFGKRKNLARSVVLVGFVDSGTVGESGRGEVVMLVDEGNYFCETDGFWCGFNFFKKIHEVLLVNGFGRDRVNCEVIMLPKIASIWFSRNWFENKF